MDFKKNPKTDFKDIDELSEKEARKEAEALREGLAHHNYRYYVKNDPIISDATFDKLFNRLRRLEETWPELRTADSPTRRIGAPPADSLQRLEHRAPMLSLNAASEESKLREFFDFVRRETGQTDLTWVAEPKFDGASVEAVFENGIFRTAATRGDGHVGEDISENLATVRTLPLRLRTEKPPASLAVRGEVFLPQKAFQELNRKRLEDGEEPYANPRNAAAGTLRRLASKIVSRLPLDIFFYDILAIDGEDFSSHWKELEAFDRWGLKTNPLNRKFSAFSELNDYRQKLIRQRGDLPYEIDGIVVKLDDLALQRELGARHRSPRWAMAWKFEPKREVTVIENIVVQVGTSGMLTPVALLQPVEVGGVTVSRATLHNEREVRHKDLRVGDKVRIERAGDVIPEVVKVIERPNKYAHKFHMPGKCPSCGAKVVREGAYVLCPAGLSCKAQLRGRIRHYGARDALDIDQLGTETARQLVQRELVTSLADLYRLQPQDLVNLEGFAEKSARQLYDAIQSARTPRLDRFLHALAIRHVGQSMAQVLARHFRSLNKLAAAGEDALQRIDGVGPEIACSVVRFFRENRRALDDLRKVGVEVRAMPAGKNELPLQGKTFVFTGSLDGCTRTEAEQAVQDLGARTTSSVSGQTDYLVVGANPGSKVDDARKRNTRILDEKDFQKLLARFREA
jgi:DNA ligase (NAD+)